MGQPPAREDGEAGVGCKKPARGVTISGVGQSESSLDERVSQEDLYHQAADSFGAALERLARAYEADPDKRRDLMQEIHLALWRSFDGFAGRCSLRTWVYRVAHNTAASHVIRQRRSRVQTSALHNEFRHWQDSVLRQCHGSSDPQ